MTPAAPLVDVVVPVATSSTNSKLRVHWRVNRKSSKAERQATALSLARRHLKPEVPVTVTLTRISERFLDDDNVRGVLKAVRDEVAAWLGVDDGSDAVTWVYRQEKKPRGCFGVRIVIEEARS